MAERKPHGDSWDNWIESQRQAAGARQATAGLEAIGKIADEAAVRRRLAALNARSPSSTRRP